MAFNTLCSNQNLGETYLKVFCLCVVVFVCLMAIGALVMHEINFFKFCLISRFSIQVGNYSFKTVLLKYNKYQKEF